MDHTRRLKSLGKTLRACRKRAGLTLTRCAAMADISKGNLSKIEHGSNLTVATLYSLCQAMGTRPKFVLPDFKFRDEALY